jgi:glycine hydroxymethyltransferase
MNMDMNGASQKNLADIDVEISNLIDKDLSRQNSHIHLIASENFASKAVMEASGSILTNKYSEGFPGRRYYEGCETVDEIEQLAIDRACELFDADHCKCSASLWIVSKYGSLSSIIKCWRYCYGDEP